MPVRTPSYRLHRPTGQAVVTLNGRDSYLGRHGSPESKAEYDRLVAEWLCRGRRPSPAPESAAPSSLTVIELLLAYIRFADGYYRKAGVPTGEADNIRYAVRPLRRLYGPTNAGEFGPLALKVVRQSMIEAGLCRNEINRRTRHVIRVFGWGVENELIPPSVHHGLKAVKPLGKDRSPARESDPVKPVSDKFVDAIRPFVARQVWAMIELQRLSGMRPGEATIMRTIDLDMSGPIWEYIPGRHKTEHHGKARQIYFGPRAQAVLKPWLRADRSVYLFSPAEAQEERRAGRRRDRRSPITPSQQARKRKPKPARTPRERYDTNSYRHAVIAGCRKAKIDPWHPNQLRHNAATWLRKEFGLDVARVILGHSSSAVTEVYAEVDREKALSVMAKVG